MAALVFVEKLTKRYGRRLVLDTLDLGVDDGDFILVTGENGSGKTTLLRLLAGTVTPSRGRVRWADGADPVEARRRVGYVGHHSLLYHELTALENLELFLRIDRRDASMRPAQPALDAFGVGARAHEPAGDLSRGLQQRVALARAFATQPRLLLLDEPTTGLDRSGVDVLLQRLQSGRGRHATILATHDPTPFRDLATRAWDLQGARVHERGVNA